jgi:hypothetical protein
MVIYWPYIAVAVAFIIGALIGHGKGRADEREDALNREKQIKINQMWMNMMKDRMGGQNG